MVPPVTGQHAEGYEGFVAQAAHVTRFAAKERHSSESVAICIISQKLEPLSILRWSINLGLLHSESHPCNKVDLIVRETFYKTPALEGKCILMLRTLRHIMLPDTALDLYWIQALAYKACFSFSTPNSSKRSHTPSRHPTCFLSTSNPSRRKRLLTPLRISIS